MGLKGTKQMLAIARDIAKGKGIQKVYRESEDIFIVGFALFRSEIKRVFYENGFTRDSTITKYVRIWESCGWIVRGRNGVIFFFLEEDDENGISSVENERKYLGEQGLTDCQFVGAIA